jgi:hypothetical protein
MQILKGKMPKIFDVVLGTISDEATAQAAQAGAYSTGEISHHSVWSHTPWTKYQIAISMTFICYIALVRMLRYRRMTMIEALFAHGKRELSTMTTQEAQEIIAQLQELEFPYAFGKARKIALLKVRKPLHSVHEESMEHK